MLLLVHNFQQAGMQLVHKKKTDSHVRCTKFEHSILGRDGLSLAMWQLFAREAKVTLSHQKAYPFSSNT